VQRVRRQTAACAQQHQRRCELQTCRNPWRCSSLRPARSYLEIDRDEWFILVRITLTKGLTTDAKRAFYRRLRSCSPTARRWLPKT
jgi:Tautomerase enzyme